jgi:glycine cleavage system H protein
MSEWKTVSIRQELIKEIERFLKTGRYRSISEFVSEAIRLRLEELVRVEGLSFERRVEHGESVTMSEESVYTPRHTWAQVIADGNVRVGLTDYAQSHLKGLAHINIAPVGREARRMEPFGVAETWMFRFDLYAPVSGKIVRVNEALRDDPRLVNEDPYGRGWIAEIKPNNSLTLEEELKGLLSAREYSKLIDRQESRLRA